MYNKIILFSIYSLILNIFFRPINSNVATVFGYITILLGLLYPVFLSIRNGKVLMNKKVLLFLIVFLFSMLLSLNSFTFENFDNQVLSILSFICFYWSLSYRKIEHVERQKSICVQDICKANYLLCFVLLLYGYGSFSFRYTVTNMWGNTIFTMGLGNPNSVSVYVMFAIMITLINIVVQKKIIVRIINIIIIAFLFGLLILLSSRTVVACVILLLIGYLVGRKSNLMRLFWGIVIVFPLIMIFITIMIGEYDLSFHILGKALETGRSDMYSSFVSDVKSSPLAFLFGQYFKYKFNNMHNAPLTIVANGGIVGLVLYLSFWYKELKAINENCVNLVQRIAFYSILAFIIHSSTEALSMIGTIPYSVMVVIINRIAIGDIVDRDDLRIDLTKQTVDESTIDSETIDAN